MPNLNFVALMGNLTRDVEMKVIEGTQQSLSIGGIAVNERRRNKAGEIKETVMFIDFEAWGHTAEAMSRYLSKGVPVMLEGKLKLDQWKDAKTGVNRYKHKIVVYHFQRLTKKDIEQDSVGAAGDGGEGAGHQESGEESGGDLAEGEPEPKMPAKAPYPTGATHEPLGEADIPF